MVVFIVNNASIKSVLMLFIPCCTLVLITNLNTSYEPFLFLCDGKIILKKLSITIVYTK